MSLRLLICLLILVFAVLPDSCKVEREDRPDMAGLVIQSGFICGWGSGTDSIQITRDKIRYVYYIPRKSSLPQITKERAVPESEWNEIVKCVNIDQFTKLNYNSCNVCFDGCDEWISLQNKTISHRISYSKGAQIDTISTLQNKLARLRTEFGN